MTTKRLPLPPEPWRFPDDPQLFGGQFPPWTRKKDLTRRGLIFYNHRSYHSSGMPARRLHKDIRGRKGQNGKKEFKISSARLKELEDELKYLKTTREKEVAEQIKGGPLPLATSRRTANMTRQKRAGQALWPHRRGGEYPGPRRYH